VFLPSSPLLPLILSFFSSSLLCPCHVSLDAVAYTSWGVVVHVVEARVGWGLESERRVSYDGYYVATPGTTYKSGMSWEILIEMPQVLRVETRYVLLRDALDLLN